MRNNLQKASKLAQGKCLIISSVGFFKFILYKGFSDFKHYFATGLLTTHPIAFHLFAGNNSIGDLIPGYFAEIGLQNIQVYISDKTSPMFPPYASKEQQVSKQLSLDWLDRGIWEQNEALRYFLAGGGTASAFEAYWLQMLQGNPLFKESLLSETFHSSGGSLMYLISGQKQG